MNELKKICVVGAGRWGLNHVKTLDEINALGGIVDKNLLVLNGLKSSYPSCLTFFSLEESFETNFYGYIVSTPPKTHFEVAKPI